MKNEKLRLVECFNIIYKHFPKLVGRKEYVVAKHMELLFFFPFFIAQGEECAWAVTNINSLETDIYN